MTKEEIKKMVNDIIDDMEDYEQIRIQVIHKWRSVLDTSFIYIQELEYGKQILS